jgi:NADH-quinone oxidoreductase subunit L
MQLQTTLALGVLIPLASFVILAFWGARIGKPMASVVALTAIGASCIIATQVLLQWIGLSAIDREQATAAAFRYHWASLGNLDLTVGVKLDSLTVIMYFMVTFIAFWIHFFSIGYMEGHSDEVDGQSKYHRFFAYLSLFCFSMLGLVISSSLLFLFIFWELVGLCSYLLIGFYFDKKFASDAAIKAFITNRIGDFGFILGMALVALYLGTLDLDLAAQRFAEQFHNHSGIFANTYTLFGFSVATLMGIGLFCGAMGKSAQFPLHVWLPDAMAGPTPVSALIHAATMVAAGVYLVARIFRLLTPEAQMFIAVIGCITLTITALIAIVQTDIKKVLAYSTLSQLGYMIFGMGCGAWIAALFHLMTHAFFKAMLFLGSGQVIEGCHHEQDIRKMGGLRKKMPVTCWTFFIGVLAIAGFGIPLTHFGLGGFFSKDEILAVAYERAYNLPELTKTDAAADDAGEHGDAESHHDHVQGEPASMAIAAKLPALPKWMFWIPIIIAYVTPFYMMRVWWLTFCGKPRDHHVYDHAHENWKMFVPLVVLAIGTVFCSYRLFRPMIHDAAVTATRSPTIVAIDGEAHDTEDLPSLIEKQKDGSRLVYPIGIMLNHAEGHNPHAALAKIVGPSWLVGMALAVFIYWRGLAMAEGLKRRLAPIHYALEQKLFFDHVYNKIIVGGTVTFGFVCGLFDKIVVDGLVNLTGLVVKWFGILTGRQLDMPVNKGDFGLVDAVANGIAETMLDIGTEIRRPQSGRIRMYVMVTAGCAAVALIVVLNYDRLAACVDWLVSTTPTLAEK